MALILTAFDLVVRVDALPGGVERFGHVVPNPTFCTDGRIARASFMVSDDRAHFASGLAIPADAIALADKHTCSANVPWLECGRYAGVDAVWLRGEPREPLVVPVRWRPGELSFGTAEEIAQQMEYLGSENGVEVYRDRRTGQKRYTGRTRPSLDPAEAKRLDALRSEASTLIGRSVLGHGALGFFEKRRLRKGIALLEQITAVVPDHWPSHWTIGMTRRRLGEEEAALTSLRRAYELEKSNPDVGREYAGQCFRLGLGEEGLRVSRELHARFPDHVGLHSNLALALLIGGDLDEAQDVAAAALQREPNDPVTRNLVDYIGKVKAGLVRRPTRLPGM